MHNLTQMLCSIFGVSFFNECFFFFLVFILFCFFCSFMYSCMFCLLSVLMILSYILNCTYRFICLISSAAKHVSTLYFCHYLSCSCCCCLLFVFLKYDTYIGVYKTTSKEIIFLRWIKRFSTYWFDTKRIMASGV